MLKGDSSLTLIVETYIGKRQKLVKLGEKHKGKFSKVISNQRITKLSG